MLPGGYWDSSGALHREFELAVLTGRDEEMLAETRLAQTASLVTAVISRSVRRVGDISPVTEQVARQLLVADRQYLLLKLRQSTFGDNVRANMFCPWADCGRRVDIEFRIEDLPVEEPAERAPVYSFMLSPGASGFDDETTRAVSFRLPNGEDQEAIGPMLTSNEAVALSMLLRRAIRSIGHASSPVPDILDSLSSMARAEIEAEMERLSPKIALNIDAVCSECGRSFAVPFDVHRLLFGDLRTDSDVLYRQVHYLAYHYHWSEAEIMAMPRNKRHSYIELLADEMERLNDGE